MTGRIIKIGDLSIDVTKKNIKNIHLSVYPPHGRVRVSAPEYMKLDTIRVFIISKLEWIRRQQKKLEAQERETPREFLNRESHYVWGKRYLLKIVETNEPSGIDLKHSSIVMSISPNSSESKRQSLIENWYRIQLKQQAQTMIAKWEPIIGVRVKHIFIQKMKTMWGSCNHNAGSIRLNTDLAKKPIECLEYIIVHELVHLLEPTHNARFVSYMDHYLPHWHQRREQLNRLPLRHEDWKY